MEIRDMRDIASEIAFLYLKIFGVAMSSYLLLSAQETIEILVSVVILLFFVFVKYEWKEKITKEDDN